jgi:hypothetical protein
MMLNTQLSSAKGNVWSCTSTPPYVFMVWCLFKHKNDFIFLYISLPLHLVIQSTINFYSHFYTSAMGN